MYSMILVPLDGSEYANQALKVAVSLARGEEKSRLHLMTVAEFTPDNIGLLTGGATEPYSAEEHKKLAQGMRDEAHKVIEQARAAVDLGGLEVEESVRQGHPAEQITEEAERVGADVIVMGSRGLGNVRGMIFGSVSHKVSHTASCGVITVT